MPPPTCPRHIRDDRDRQHQTRLRRTQRQIHKYTNTQIQRQQQIRLCRTIRYKQDIKVKEVEIQTYSKQNTQYVYKEIQGGSSPENVIFDKEIQQELIDADASLQTNEL